MASPTDSREFDRLILKAKRAALKALSRKPPPEPPTEEIQAQEAKG